jgi:nicotinate-nucleotide adenylyltransferase
MRLGLFGGTFDPVHRGHLDVARAARRALGLDVLWWLPAPAPPHRTEPRVSVYHRFAMVALAIQDEGGMIVSDIEMNEPGPTYTSDTLARLAAGGWRPGSLFFVTGADAFRDIGQWRNYPRLLDAAHFVVVSRPGAPASALSDHLPALAGRMVSDAREARDEPRIVLLDAPTAAVSSTEVRRAAASGADLRPLVPVSVATYIDRHRLYALSAPHSKGTA